MFVFQSFVIAACVVTCAFMANAAPSVAMNDITERSEATTDGFYGPSWVSNGKRGEDSTDSFYGPSWASGGKRSEENGNSFYGPSWESGA